MEKLNFPNRITVELTNDCNLGCTFCNRQKICMDIGFMSDELFYKIIDEASEHLPVKLVPFFRGEPLMHPRIIDFIKYAKQKGLGPIQMASNALLLDNEMQDALIETGIDYVSFSLDTDDEAVYKKTRKSGNLRQSMENVRSFAEKCRRRKSFGKHTPETQVSTINIEEYIASHDSFVNYWRKYVDVVRIYEQHDEKGQLVDPKLRKKLDIFTDRKPCRKIFTDIIIYWDGRVSLCNYDWDEKRNIGDISKASISDVWNSPEFEKIRREHNEGKICDGICKDCHHWKIDYMDNGYLGKSYVHEQEEHRK